MAFGFPTSDRLCRVITKNFMADQELQKKLARIERKKQKASVQMTLHRMEVERELERIGPFVKKNDSDKNAQLPRNNHHVFVLSGSTIPAERRRRNMRSYREILQKFQSNNAANPPRPPGILRKRNVLPKLVSCDSPPLLEGRVKPLFRGFANYPTIKDFNQDNKKGGGILRKSLRFESDYSKFPQTKEKSESRKLLVLGTKRCVMEAKDKEESQTEPVASIKEKTFDEKHMAERLWPLKDPRTLSVPDTVDTIVHAGSRGMMKNGHSSDVCKADNLTVSRYSFPSLRTRKYAE